MAGETKRVKFSDKLLKILKSMEDNNSYLAFELLWMNDPTAKYHNGLNITNVKRDQQRDVPN